MVYLKRSKRFLNKTQKTTPTLSPLTTRHLVPRLHFNLVACQQSVRATCRILQKD